VCIIIEILIFSNSLPFVNSGTPFVLQREIKCSYPFLFGKGRLGWNRNAEKISSD